MREMLNSLANCVVVKESLSFLISSILFHVKLGFLYSGCVYIPCCLLVTLSIALSFIVPRYKCLGFTHLLLSPLGQL